MMNSAFLGGLPTLRRGNVLVQASIFTVMAQSTPPIVVWYAVIIASTWRNFSAEILVHISLVLRSKFSKRITMAGVRFVNTFTIWVAMFMNIGLFLSWKLFFKSFSSDKKSSIWD